MAKRAKKEELSPRQRKSQKIMRDKQKKKARQHIMKRVQIGVAVVAVIALAAGGFWGWKNSIVSKAIQAVSDKIYGTTANAGYVVETLYLEGRNRTPIGAVNDALDIDKGTPIFKLSLSDIRARLEAIESVKSAAVERALPNTLYVRIVEREPVALWQYQGKLALIDDNGVAMMGLDRAPYKNLPLVVGDGAPKQVKGVLELLAVEPDLAKRFSAAVWVGDRRWNIRLKPKAGGKDIEVRLPEKNPLAAWNRLAEMQQKEHMLDRDVLVIDLRVEGRLFITLPEQEPPAKNANAKET